MYAKRAGPTIPKKYQQDVLVRLVKILLFVIIEKTLNIILLRY